MGKQIEKKKSNNTAVCIICGILTAFGIVAGIISLFSGSGAWIVNDIILLVLSLLIGYYAFVGYKKPHGNLLKYIILLYALNCIFNLKVTAQVGNTVISILTGIKIGLMCYVAGRLVRAKENLVILIVLSVIDIGVCLWQAVSGNVSIGIIAFLVIWLDICIAYFLRYKEHKEAGLTDAPATK